MIIMKKCGLLGEKLAHSYSPQIHSRLADYEYLIYEKRPDEVESFLRSGEFDGLNVTIPYKKTAFALCDELSDTAKKLGNVNTIVRLPDGRLFGHNTDYFGFDYVVKSSGISVEGKKAVVLGSGGASATVCAVLEDLGAAQVVVISRGGEDNYDNISRHYDARIIVNATPVGMYPNNGSSLLDLEKFSECEWVCDLIYNPAKTALLLQAEALGIPCRNGLAMLVAQAKESAEYFGGEPIENSVIEKITAELSREMLNIILIGMPGSGKSTIGRIIAEKTGRRFIDVDEYIVEQAGMSVFEMFAGLGEEGFRKYETAALNEVCRLSACVISTGGGCITREENYRAVRQNGSVAWIQRDIDLLPTAGRPLSATNDLNEMYKKRKPLYEKFSDFSVENMGEAEQAAEKIMELYYENNGN